MSLGSKIMQVQLQLLRNLPRLSQFRCFSSVESIKDRNEIFNEETQRQRNNVGRIEKIEIRYLGLPEDVTLVMNKDISTPYNCAQHLSEGHCKRSALGLIDSNVAWDMHRPLQESCTLQLLNFTIVDPHLVNKAFWRTCSFMLGAALQTCFKEEANLQLHSFPGPNIKSGSFVHDIVLSSQGWKPNTKELRTMSAEMIKLAAKNLPIERLEVNYDIAMEMFKDSQYKKQQLPSISTQNQGRVTVYRIGDHIDISRGPMIGNSSFVGKCTVSSVHEIRKEDKSKGIYRVQGVALPTGIIINHFAYGILEERSRKLNPARLPNEPFEEHSIDQLMA